MTCDGTQPLATQAMAPLSDASVKLITIEPVRVWFLSLCPPLPSCVLLCPLVLSCVLICGGFCFPRGTFIHVFDGGRPPFSHRLHPPHPPLPPPPLPPRFLPWSLSHPAVCPPGPSVTCSDRRNNSSTGRAARVAGRCRHRCPRIGATRGSPASLSNIRRVRVVWLDLVFSL